MPDTGREADYRAVAALCEPIRRRLYDYVLTCPEPVGRDEAAAALGLARQTAAFHLDRLAEVGLVGVEFARRNGMAGPGAGRPAKFYLRSERRISVQLPPRPDVLAGELTAAAIDAAAADGGAVLDHLARLGHRVGRGRSLTAGRGTPAAVSTLIRLGYGLRADTEPPVVTSCPFTADRAGSVALATLSLAMVRGVLDGAGQTGLRAEPADGQCPVRLVGADDQP